jgi:light-regulated signal transduction histidine kinase (bacteriophytochrome)
VRVTIQNFRKDGTSFWNDLVMSPLTDDEGNTTHFLGMQLDITDRIKAEEKLKAKTAELQQSNRELEQFTYAASHDLQEPLRMISSYLQLIRKRYEQVFDASGKTFLNYATEGAERMQGLIYDLLALSKVTASTDTFKTIDLAKAVGQADFNLKLLIDETGAVIETAGLPTVKADPIQMAQLFQNLIGNAIKYRRPGVPPYISVTSKRDDDHYVISVADNGIGIEKQNFDRIFMIFHRLHTRSEYAGSGVGLAICARILERHGGKIWVESSKGEGSTFKFSIPIKQKDTTHA